MTVQTASNMLLLLSLLRLNFEYVHFCFPVHITYSCSLKYLF